MFSCLNIRQNLVVKCSIKYASILHIFSFSCNLQISLNTTPLKFEHFIDVFFLNSLRTKKNDFIFMRWTVIWGFLLSWVLFSFNFTRIVFQMFKRIIQKPTNQLNTVIRFLVLHLLPLRSTSMYKVLNLLLLFQIKINTANAMIGKCTPFMDHQIMRNCFVSKLLCHFSLTNGLKG